MASMLWGCTSSDPVVQLIEHLRSDFGARREKACRQLGRLGSQARKAVGALRRVLAKDPNDYVRRCAADALGKMGPAAAAAIPELTRALRDVSGGVRMAAAAALGKLKDKALPTLRKLIKGKDGHSQIYAVRALADLGHEGIPLLEYAVKSRYLQVLQATAEALIKMGRGLEKKPTHASNQKAQVRLTRALFKLLRVPNLKLRTHVTWSLSDLGPAAARHSGALTRELLQALVELLDNAPNQVKMYAAYSLRKIGEAAKQDGALRGHMQAGIGASTLARLQKLLADPVWYIRKHAASALAALLPALRPRSKTGKAATQYRRHLKRSIAALGQALYDPTWDVRYEATRTLRALIHHKRAVLALMGPLSSKKWRLRKHVIRNLGWIAKDKPHPQTYARKVLPALLKALRDPQQEVQAAGWEALVPGGSQAAAAILERYKRARSQERLHLLAALAKIEKPGASTSRFLKKQLAQAKDPYVKLQLYRALRRHVPGFKPATVDATKAEGLLFLASSSAKMALSSLSTLAARWGQLKAPEDKVALVVLVGQQRKRPYPEALVVLQRALVSGPRLQRAAAQVLARWPLTPRSQPLLLKALAVKHLATQKLVVEALSKKREPQGFAAQKAEFQRTDSSRLPALLGAYANKALRRAVVQGMSGFGVAYFSRSLPLLHKALADKNPKVQADAAEALAWIMPVALVHGWKEPLLRKLYSQDGPHASRLLAQIHGIKDIGSPKALARRIALAQHFKQKVPSPAWSALNQKLLGALQRAVDSPAARVRRNALFALGNTGIYAPKKQREELLHFALQLAVKKTRKQVKHNLCLLMERWLVPSLNGVILDKLGKITLDTRAPKATRKACEATVRSLRSDDKPYVFWVSHPRSPTLEAFEPSLLLPHGP